MSDLFVVILAAGQGKRMKSARPKVLHELAGRSLIGRVLRTARALEPSRTVLVIGHGGDDVRTALAAQTDLEFVVQSPQLGTGHALLQAEPILAGKHGTLLLLYADVPLLERNTLTRLVEHHRSTAAAATVLTADVSDPYGYGRIVRDRTGAIARIVEERDASTEERAIHEVNSGIYALALAPLFESLKGLAADNAQGEYYLTDLVAQYRRRNLPVETLRIDDPTELRGVNSREDLSDLTRVVRLRRCQSAMRDGATLEDPATTYIDDDVTIGPDTVVAPGVILSGRTTIGARCHLHAGARIVDSAIGDDVTVLDRSVILESSIGARARVGPFAYLRPKSVLAEEAHVGAFVELKKTKLGRRSKANHLAYLGDATIGEDVNIGAGVITCNFDGAAKYPTVIQDGAFVGTDSQLVAPVTIGKNAYVAAGSSITEDVPADSLAIGRGRQTNKAGWALARRSARKEE